MSQTYRDVCQSFYAEANRKIFEDYIGLDRVIEEFVSLGLPKASEVLNANCGPGIISAYLQTRGYTCIDGQDTDSATIINLRDSGLYRNLICRQIDGLNHSGLKEEVYDAIVLVGGFKPDSLTELLRVLKTDGEFIFTFREDELHESGFSLLDSNLEGLEKDKKIRIVKAGERFKDERSDLSGVMYVVKKRDSEDFVSEVPRSFTEDVEDSMKHFKIDDDQKVTVFVDKPAENDLIEVVGEYTGHVKLCEAFFKLRLKRNVEILDISCRSTHPGLVGQCLGHNGYEAVDGLDVCLSSLNEARISDTYRNYILGRCTDINSIPVRDETYDVILMAGAFAPSKLGPSSFPELLRILRPGGLILFVMEDGLITKDPDFALFDVRMEDLIYDRKWELLVGPVFFDNYAAKTAGRFYMLRKLHKEIFAMGSPRYSPVSSPSMTRRRRGSLHI